MAVIDEELFTQIQGHYKLHGFVKTQEKFGLTRSELREILGAHDFEELCMMLEVQHV